MRGTVSVDGGGFAARLCQVVNMPKMTTPSDSSDQAPAAELLTQRLHAEHGAALLSWAVGRVPDRRDAEEVVAETLVRAWRRH